MARLNRSHASLAGLAAVTLAASSALAQVDGTMGAGSLAFGEYQFKLASQTVQTQFGDTYSQLDAMYVNILPNGSVGLMLTGNLEANFNGLITYVDTGRAGAVGAQGSVNGDGTGNFGSVPGSFTYSWGTRDGAGKGSTVAAGFDPSLAIQVNGGAGDTPTYYTNVTDISRASSEFAEADVYIGSNSWKLRDGTGTVAATTGTYDYKGIQGTVEHAFDSSNLLTFPDSVANNNTGYEAVISAGVLRTLPGHEVKILTFVTGSGGGGYLSNQFFPPAVSGTGNLATGTTGTQDENGIYGRLFDVHDHPEITYITLPTPTNSSGSNWGTDANWTTGFAPNGINTQAAFSTGASARVVNVDNSPTVGTLYLAGAGGITFSGATGITLATYYTDSTVIRVESGSHTIGVPVALASPVSVEVPSGSKVTFGSLTATDPAGTSGLAVSGGGNVKIDGKYAAGELSLASLGSGGYDGAIEIGANATVISRTAFPSVLRNAIVGYQTTGGTSGIGSPELAMFETVALFPNVDAEGNAYYSSYNGLPATAGDVIMRVAYVGDLNVDGVVTAADVAQAIEGYSNGLTGWENGDVNYDGVVGADDLALILDVFNLNLPSLGNGPTGGGADGGSIPEPAFLPVYLFTSALLLRRRR